MTNASLSFSHPRIKENNIRYIDGKVEAFDFNEGKYRNPYSFTKKQKRLFRNTYSGLQVGYYKKQMLIFLTLTTKYEKMSEKGTGNPEEIGFNRWSKKRALRKAEKELNKHFQLFKHNLEYQVQKWRFEDWILKTYGVVDRHEYRRLYKYNFRRFKYKLCYLKVRTTEGGGVIHALIRKDLDIPKFDQKWCSQEWERIHGAKNVWLERIQVNPEQPLKDALNSSFYFCGNYFNQQPVMRQSSSYDWIFRGSSSAWCGRKEVLGIKKEKKEFVYRTKEEKIRFGNACTSRMVAENRELYSDLKYQKFHDEIAVYVPYHRVKTEKNVLWVREGLIQKCCNSQIKPVTDSYSLECFFEIGGALHKTGFERALEL